MATITFSCDACGQVLRTAADKAGKKAKCVKCGKILTIPSADEAETSAPVDTSVRPGKAKPGPPPLPQADEGPPRGRLRDDEEAEEDRPRKRRPPDDEADEARPRRRPDDDEDDDRPRRRRDEDDDAGDLDDDRDRPKGMSKRARWAKVRVGLLLTFISACILIGYGAAMVFATLMGYIGNLNRSIDMLDIANVLMKIAIVLNFLLQLPVVAGYVFTLFTPNKNGALAFSITALSLGVVNLGLKVFGLIAVFDARPGRGGGGILAAGLAGVPDFGATSRAAVIIIIIFVLLLVASEWIVFPLYLRSAALNLKNRYLAGGAMMPMFFACGVVGLQILTVILMVSAPPRFVIGGGIPAMFHVYVILSIITQALLVAFAVLYMRAQNHIRGAID